MQNYTFSEVVQGEIGIPVDPVEVEEDKEG